MKYKSELINEIIETGGHVKSTLHYQSECVETWIEEVRGAYPKLTDYEGEWLNYYLENAGVGEFPYLALTNITSATVDNCVPIRIKSAILKGNTKYRDIDTEDILDTFDETKNLELVSVRMPVLTTTGKNLIDNPMTLEQGVVYELPLPIYVKKGDKMTFIVKGLSTNIEDYQMFSFGDNKNISLFNSIAHTGNGSRFLEGELRTITLTASKDGEIKYFKYGNSGHPATATIEKIMLCLGEGESYEPYKSNILTANEPVELRGIGDVKDTLDLTTGELTQRIGDTLIDKMDSHGATTSNGIYYIPNSKMPQGFKYSEKTLFIDKNNVVNKIISGGTGNWHFHVNQKTDGMYYTKAEVNEFLAKNSIQFFGELITPTIKTVDLSITNQDGESLNNLKAIEGTMHIETASETIKPLLDIEVPVEAIIQNLNSFIEEE